MHNLLLATAALMVIGSTTSAHAEYPEKNVTVIVNSVPGGGADTLARTLADALSQELGQPFVVDNKPGAGGNLAGNTAANASPDGYTLLLADSGMLVINPSLYASMPFDPFTAFEPITRVASFPIVIAANPGSGYGSLQDLIAAAKSSPGTINYASTGIGSPQHLAAELLQSAAGIELVHIPFKGGAPALTDLVAGRVPVGFIGIPPTAPRIKSGELVGLGVTTPERSPLLSDVPTVAESLGEDFEASVWFALLAPEGTPEGVVQTLNQAVNTVLSTPEMQEKLTPLGYTAQPGTVQELEQDMRTDAARWKEAVEASGAKVE